MAIYLPVQEGVPKIVVNLGTTLSLRRERQLDSARLSLVPARPYTTVRHAASVIKRIPEITRGTTKPRRHFCRVPTNSTAPAVVTGEKRADARKARGEAFIRKVVIKKRFPLADAVLCGGFPR